MKTWYLSLIGLVGSVSCTGTETGNPNIGQVRLAVHSSDPSVVDRAGQGGMGEGGAGGSGGGLYLTNAAVGLESLSFVACDTSSIELIEEPRVVDLLDAPLVGEVPTGTFCGVRLTWIPWDLNYPSLDTTDPDAPLAVGLRLESAEGGVLSFEGPLETILELGSSTAQPFELSGEEDVVVSVDVAQLVELHELETPILDGNHIIDPSHTTDVGVPSPLQSSTKLYAGEDATGEELGNGEHPIDPG
jgi:hypothetical protein